MHKCEGYTFYFSCLRVKLIDSYMNRLATNFHFYVLRTLLNVKWKLKFYHLCVHSYVYFKKNQIALPIGHVAEETVNIMNDEENTFCFTIDESSRHAAGHVASLQINPLKGVLAPNSK